MGFLGPISAEDVNATLNPLTGQLTLVAKGTIQDFTSGIKFTSDTWLGGFKFSLLGWTGPLNGKDSPYTHTQIFEIGAAKPEFVIVVTANHPEGLPVNVQKETPTADGTPTAVDNGKQANGETRSLPRAGDKATPSSTAKTAVGEISTPVLDPPMTVLFKEAFNIQYAAQVPPMGSVDMNFDTRYLTLLDASIQNNQIVWKFNSVETGDTQAILTISGGIAAFIMKKIFNIHIIVLAGVPIVDIKEATPTGATTSTTGLVINYLGRAEVAKRLVQKNHPDAETYIVTASTSDPAGTTSPIGLGHMKVVFHSKQSNSWVQITSSGYDTWNLPEPTAGMIGSAFIDQWPMMDALEADAILKQESITGPYTSLTLRHFLSPGVESSMYEFGMLNGQTWSIDTARKVLVTQ